MRMGVLTTKLCAALPLGTPRSLHARPPRLVAVRVVSTSALTGSASMTGLSAGLASSSAGMGAPGGTAGGGGLHAFSRCRALVLDSSYRPIDVVTWQRAICLDLFDKVDVLEYYDTYVRSARTQFLIPAVLRVRMFVSARSRGSGRLAVSRRNILIRDKCTCQYCGAKSNLTIDHVIPTSKGGKWTWENLVTACTKCNGKKGDKSLKAIGWRLKTRPTEPSPYQFGVLLGSETANHTPPKEWSDYLFPVCGSDKLQLGADLQATEAATL